MILVSQFDSPLGKIAVAERSKKVLAVCFGGRRALRTQYLELWDLDEVQESAEGPCAAKVRHYLDGGATKLNVAFDLSLVKGAFDREVLARLCKVRAGKTVRYGELAEMLGRPRAARAVGGAMRRNPIPVVVPCHRVLPSAGGLGNYTGGVKKKAWLLAREGSTLEA